MIVLTYESPWFNTVQTESIATSDAGSTPEFSDLLIIETFKSAPKI